MQRVGTAEGATNHVPLAVLDATRDLHLAVAREQRDRRHLAEIHAHRIDVGGRLGLGGDRCRFADVLFGVAAVRLRHRDVVVLRVERPEHGDHAVETLEGAVIGVLGRLLRYLIPAHLWKPSPLVCASCVLRGCWTSGAALLGQLLPLLAGGARRRLLAPPPRGAPLPPRAAPPLGPPPPPGRPRANRGRPLP